MGPEQRELLAVRSIRTLARAEVAMREEGRRWELATSPEAQEIVRDRFQLASALRAERLAWLELLTW